MASTHSAFLKHFRCLRFSEFDSNILSDWSQKKKLLMTFYCTTTKQKKSIHVFFSREKNHEYTLFYRYLFAKPIHWVNEAHNYSLSVRKAIWTWNLVNCYSLSCTTLKSYSWMQILYLSLFPLGKKKNRIKSKKEPFT